VDLDGSVGPGFQAEFIEVVGWVTGELCDCGLVFNHVA
jgi:hypothetical protein